MYLPMRARRALTALLASAAFLLGATATARADDDPDLKPAQLTSSETKTVRLVQGKDGEFVLETADGESYDSSAPMRVILRKAGEEGQPQVFELKEGKWVGRGQPMVVERDVVVHRTPASVAAFGHAPAGGNPMATVLRWLLTDGMAGELPNDPLKGWFEGGPGVPMAGLRDALKADGWTASSLQAWFLQHLVGGMAALQAPAPAPHAMHPPVPAPTRGRWFEIGRGHGRCDSCGCDCSSRMQRRPAGPSWRGNRQGRGQGRRQARRGGCDCNAPRGRGQGCGSCAERGSCGSCRGDCGSCGARGSRDGAQGRCKSCDGSCGQQQGRGQARRQAFLLWNDGTGWQHRPVDAQGPVARSETQPAAREGLTFRGESTDDPPELTRMIRELLGEADAAPASARIIVEGLDLLPPDLLEQVPPGVLEGVLKELQGLGLGELLAPAKRGCADCPKQGECKGGDCGKGTDGKSGGCGTCKGECKGECKDCPKARDGSCPGDCKGCPKKQGADAK